MKRSTARWTTALAAAAWLAAPAAGWSQTPSAQKPTTSPPAAQKPAASAHGEHGSAQEHLRQARASLNDIPAAGLPASARQRVTELKRRINTLEKSAASTGTTATKSPAKGNWGTEVAAIDKILTELLGPATTSATSEPTGATGTAGSTGTTKSRSTTTMTLDESAKTKLMEVRTHITAFASAMSGAAPRTPGAPDSEPATDPSTVAASQPPASTANTQDPAATSQPPTTASATQAPQSATPSAAGETAQAGQAPAQAQPSSGAQVNPDEAKKHLTAARDTLSQLTQLPAAAQLQGDARTQVSQLITNFNELITTNENWRAAYDKVNANVTALVGAADAAAPEQPAPSATPGAVGTTGAAAATIDPAIRAKLVEFRNHLVKFEQAAGGGATPSAASAPAASGTTAATTSTTPEPTGTTGTTPASTTAEPASTAPTPTGTTGMTGATSSTADQSASGAKRPEAAAAEGQDGALRHIEAIEAILAGRGAAAGNPASATGSAQSTPGATRGTAGTTDANVTLDRSQVEQIRMHLAELRKSVGRK